MRWHLAGMGALALGALTGCPEEFGKEGRIDRAIHQDVRERLRKNCSEQELQQYCPPGLEQSEECVRRCDG